MALLVDDNPQISALLADLLTFLNCDSIIAEDGEEALKLVAKRKPDFILLDVMMPKMSGISVLSAIKRDPATKDFPVIMVSGEQKSSDLDTAFRLGAADYIIKPVRKTEFETKIGALLSTLKRPSTK